MAWLFLALVLIGLYLMVTVRPDAGGVELDRKRLRGIEAGRAQQRREHAARCAGGCDHE